MKRVRDYENEQVLMEDFRLGKQFAFQQFYNLQYRSVWLYASKILDSKEKAEDVVAENFIKIWNRREEFETLKGLVAFLFTITRNACLSILDQEKRRMASHRQIAYLAQKEDDSIHTKLVRTELLQLILLETESLPPRLREVFQLIYLEGLTLPETAERLGVSLNTIKTQQSTAVKKMRGAFQKKGIRGLTVTWLGL